MTEALAHSRAYIQSRLHEEISRAERYGREFALLVFEAAPSNDGLPTRKKAELAIDVLTHTVRPSDVVAHVFEDTVVVLLVETGALGARDALFRVRQRLAARAGNWRVTTYAFPTHADAIRGLPLLSAA